MKVRLFSGEIETLRPLVESWRGIAEDNDVGIIVDDADKFLLALRTLAIGPGSDLLALYEGDEPVGILGLQYFDSPLGKQGIANEKYFFVMPEHRGSSSVRLIKDAKTLARLKGADRLIMTASNLASDSHDKVCRMYERMGMKLFETSFIIEV